MGKECLLSIIIPLFNAELFINDCVEKLENQKFTEFELILINDGSTDSTDKCCKELLNKYHNIIYKIQENKGPSRAREFGLKSATGKYVTFVDADDYVDTKAYEKIITIMEQEDIDLAQFGYSIVNSSGVVLVESQFPQILVGQEGEPFEEFLKQKIFSNHLWNKIYKISLFDQIEWTDLFYSEDYVVLAQLFSKTKKIVNMPDKYYYYVQHDKSACGRAFSDRRLDEVKAGKFVIDYTKKVKPEFAWYAYRWLAIDCTRLAADVYCANLSNKNEIINSLIIEFKENVSQIKKEEKAYKIKVKLDKMSILFRISPILTLKIMKIKRYLSGLKAY